MRYDSTLTRKMRAAYAGNAHTTPAPGPYGPGVLREMGAYQVGGVITQMETAGSAAGLEYQCGTLEG